MYTIRQIYCCNRNHHCPSYVHDASHVRKAIKYGAVEQKNNNGETRIITKQLDYSKLTVVFFIKTSYFNVKESYSNPNHGIIVVF